MDLVKMLIEYKQQTLDQANDSLTRCSLVHYSQSGIDLNKQRLTRLYDLMERCVVEKDLIPIIEYIKEVAHDRHEAGFDFIEVQTAINVLEETVWLKITQALPPEQYAISFGMISTVLGAAKSSLAREYIQIENNTHVHTLDLTSLFKGTDSYLVEEQEE